MKLNTATVFAVSLSLVVGAFGAPSKPKEPKKDPAVEAYNAGTEHLFDLEFPEAAEDLQRAIKEDSEMAAAHNNLAYALRKQGGDHFEEALSHYNQAIKLDPELAEAFMYRGVLYVMMGNDAAARKDRVTLQELSPELADELGYVIENGKEKVPEQFFGVTAEK